MTAIGKRHALRVPLALIAAAIAALVLAGIASGPAHAASAAGTTINVKAGEMFFRLSTKTLTKPGRVAFVVKNIGHLQHDFRINGKQTPLLNPGKTARLTVTFNKKGRYPYLCTVPGHAAAGMKGVLTVR